MADKEILALAKEIIFKDDYFNGFRKRDVINYEERILSNISYMKRSTIEHNPEYKQPIAYIAITNPKTKKIFAYQRASKNKDYKEKRLQGKWTIGVGGHIEKIDAKENAIHESMLRELKEEVHINEGIKPVVLGYINDDSDSIGKVHFGILYIIETNFDVKPKDGEIASGKFMSIDEIEKIFKSEPVEGWSKISFSYLKEYLENK